jgi:hypothetical protein
MRSSIKVLKACGFFLAVFFLAGSLGASEKVAIHVTPAVSFAPANLVIRATVPSDKKNRAIEIVAESPDFYRSSEVQLDGEHAPTVTVCEFQSLPSGMYQVTAVLKGADDQPIALAHKQVNVIAAGGEPGR